MEEKYSPTPPTPPAPPSKKWRAQETITVVFLVLFPIVGLILMWVIANRSTMVVFLVLCPVVGLILMWAIANWSKTVKTIITVLFVLPLILIIGILSSIVWVSPQIPRAMIRRDVLRKADMRRIGNAQYMYYGEHDVFYTSVNYPSSIGDFRSKTFTDPKTDAPYGWIDNTGNNQKFCVYADLERDGFYVASQRGNGEVETEPRTLSDCEKLY